MRDLRPVQGRQLCSRGEWKRDCWGCQLCGREETPGAPTWPRSWPRFRTFWPRLEPEPRWTLNSAALGTAGAAAPSGSSGHQATALSAPRPGLLHVPASGTARTGRTVLPQMQPMEKHRRFLEQHAGPWTDRALRGRAVGSCVSHVAGWGRQPEIKGAPTFGLLKYKRRLLLAGRRTVSQT